LAIFKDANFGHWSAMMKQRIFQLTWGLTLYGVSMAMMIRANLGLDV
jgi:hypothetical protein